MAERCIYSDDGIHCEAGDISDKLVEDCPYLKAIGEISIHAICDFRTYYILAKNKIKLKLWSIEYAKGFLYCYLDYVLKTSDDDYNECAKLIDDLE